MVRALAACGDEAPPEASDVGRRAEALAADFDDVYTAYVDSLNELPDIGLLEALQLLDSELSTMSGEHNAELWTSRAVTTHRRWATVRELAEGAIARWR